MKQTKFLLLMLAAALFAACSSDDDDDSGKKATITFDDYSSVIGMSYSSMIRQYPNPSMQFGDFYMYENPTEKVENMTIMVNPENQVVYMVVENLKENSYKEEDIVAYFTSKFKSYGVEKTDNYDEEGNVIGQSNIYEFGNAEKEKDATLIITVQGNTITYSNPQNLPEEPKGGTLDDMNPIEAVNAFLLSDLEEIEDEYPDTFKEMGGMYACFMEENPYLMGVALNIEEGLVTSVVLLYNEDLSDEDIISYYTKAGYDCKQTGYDEEEEIPIYTFTDGMYAITYSAGRGVAVYIGEL